MPGTSKVRIAWPACRPWMLMAPAAAACTAYASSRGMSRSAGRSGRVSSHVRRRSTGWWLH